MPDVSAIPRSVLADRVKDRLLQDILSGRYPPHSRIIETRVVRELGTSQAPVREALRGLEALGVTEILPFRGARVRRPTAHELLEAIHDETQQAADAGDRHEVAVADVRFHARLLRLAANATLERVSSSLESFSRTYITPAAFHPASGAIKIIVAP